MLSSVSSKPGILYPKRFSILDVSKPRDSALFVPSIFLTLVSVYIGSLLNRRLERPIIKSLLLFTSDDAKLKTPAGCTLRRSTRISAKSIVCIDDVWKSVNKFSNDEKKFSANIYRRINNNKISKDKMKEKLENMVNSSKLLKIDNTECIVNLKRSLLNTTIVVTVKDNIKMPDFLKYIGLDNNWSRSVMATSVVTDPAEFIRNLDMAQDVINYILDKLGLSGRLETLINKVSGFYNKYIKP